MLSVRQNCVVELGSVAYYIRNRIEKTFPNILHGDTIVPVVVINVERSEIDLHDLQRIFARFEAVDDVFNSDFTTGGFLLAQTLQLDSTARPIVSNVVREYLETRSSRVLFAGPGGAETSLPEGPYFLKGQSLHQAWRLYEDDLCSFISAVVPSDVGDKHEFQPLRAGAYSGTHLVVAVPSRLYYPPIPDRPLNGKRISIKDNFHLSGVVTTVGSRSYSELYGYQNTTSEYVRELVSQGAIIVGKTKMSAYAGSEVPPEKCIDYFPPWNPRGDGYQGPSGSSSGSGSSAAGYDWLDIALGTDTTGSIRMPAASYGLWGMKATQNSFSMNGIVPGVKSFDSMGLLARTSSELINLYGAATFLQHAKATKPTQIFYPTDFYPMPNEQQQGMQEEFLHALEEALGIKHIPISLSELWGKTAPEQAGGKSLTDYMEKSGKWVNLYDGYRVYDDFRTDYEKKFGRKAYASPFMTRRWQSGIEISEEEKNQGLLECETVKQWIAKQVLIPDESGISGPIMLIPFGRPLANYRDLVPPPGKDYADTTYSPMYMASVLGLPQAVVPIGQSPYKSRVSGNTEYAPITGSFIGVRGSDAVLLEVAQAALDKAGWPSKVLTGRNTFHIGKNSRNSAVEPGAKS